MKFRFLILALFSATLITCKNKNHEINLNGNWLISNYTMAKLDSVDLTKNHNYYYEENFINDTIIYSYSNLLGFNLPRKYKLKHDSLFVGLIDTVGFDFVARISKINDSELLLIDSLGLKGKLIRLNNQKQTLDKFINFNSEYPKFEQKETEYSQAFINRSENYRLSFIKR